MIRKFKRGDLSRLAAFSGISRQFLCNILRGRRSCPPTLAELLAKEAKDLGYLTNLFDWMFPGSSKNPLFKPYRN